MAFLSVFVTALEAVGVYCLTKVLYWFIRPLFSPLRRLPQPPCSSLVSGNLNDVDGVGPLLDGWHQKYGTVMTCKGLFREDFLFTTDLKALNHVLTHSTIYQRTPEGRFLLSTLLGNGLLVTLGEKHRQQRRIMNPAFSASSIRDLTPAFFEKALQLRDIWESEIVSDNASKESSQTIEVLSWLSRATLDIIGLAGFHYQFDALGERQDKDALSKAFETILRNGEGPGILTILQATFPILRLIPDKWNVETRKARETMLHLGEELLVSRQDGGTLEKGRDLLSVLVRANKDSTLPHSQRMDNKDVLAQVPTFLVAGHETTSNQLAWALFLLAQHPDMQSRLRKELRSITTDTPSADELSAERLPFLEMVVRETLRLYGTVSRLFRIATKDDVIPVGEPYIDKKGRICNEIRIKEGERVVVPILAVNRAKHVWGEDAAQFNPDRWVDPPSAAGDVPGVWADLLSFSGGPRSCIGFRFALIEIKVILFTLLRKFEFSLALPADAIEVLPGAFTRPSVRGEKGSQLPLLVKICED